MAVRSRSSGRSTAASRPERFGRTEPRIFTPPLRKLEPRSPTTEKRTLGYAVIDFADVLGIELLPWQRWALVHMLELLPDGALRFRTVVILVARQNGKSTLSVVLSLFFMYVLGRQLVIGTAQDLDVAEEIWQQAVDLVTETDEDDEPLRPELYEAYERTINVNGKKALVLKSGERYKVKAANRRAGRSLSGDLILLDELREHQSWDAWGAITKTTMARAMALILCLSNAGDATSIVLRHLRQLAHMALGNPDGLEELPVPDEDDPDEDSLAIFEWSAKPGCAVNDWDGLAQANPALGRTITRRAITSAMGTDPEWVFRTEVMCQWSDGTLEGPFPAGAWEACLDDESRRAEGGLTLAGIDVGVDRSMTYVTFAAFRQDGLPFVRVMAGRAGTEWVADWLRENAAGVTVAGQGKGAPVSPLLDDLEGDGFPVRRWEGPDLAAGTGQFFDLVKDHRLRHLTQPALDVAAAVAVPKITDSGAMFWNRRQSPADIAPLVSATAAVWALLNQPVSTRSAYEDSDLILA